jgi:hypothetical protein
VRRASSEARGGPMATLRRSVLPSVASARQQGKDVA